MNEAVKAVGEGIPVAWARECMMGFRYAQAGGTTLLDLMNWYARDGRPLLQAPPLRQCVEDFLWSKREANRQRVTLEGYASRLRRFAERYGDWLPQLITERQIEDFLADISQPTTRSGWWHVLSTFFEWMKRRRQVLANPLADFVRPRGGASLSGVFRVAEVREILGRARDTDQIGFWVLSLFAGMRTIEIKRLAAQADPWSQVRLGDGIIEVPEGQSKTKRRAFEISPQVNAWLWLIRERGIPFCPPPHQMGAVGRLRRDVLQRSRGGLVRRADYNMGRRSFFSYALALPGASYRDLALTAGNSEKMIRRYYRRAATTIDAEAYFDLRP